MNIKSDGDTFISMVDLFMLLSILLMCITMIYGFSQIISPKVKSIPLNLLVGHPNEIVKIDEVYLVIGQDMNSKSFVLLYMPDYFPFQSLEAQKIYFPGCASTYYEFREFSGAKSIESVLYYAYKEDRKVYIYYPKDSRPLLFGGLLSMSLELEITPNVVLYDKNSIKF